jgi:hypothetical protein
VRLAGAAPSRASPVVKGMRRLIIETDEGTRRHRSVPRSVHVNVREGERIGAGDPLRDAELKML